MEQPIEKITLVIDIETIPAGEQEMLTVDDLPKSFKRPDEITSTIGMKDPEKIKAPTQKYIKDKAKEICDARAKAAEIEANDPTIAHSVLAAQDYYGPEAVDKAMKQVEADYYNEARAEIERENKILLMQARSKAQEAIDSEIKVRTLEEFKKRGLSEFKGQIICIGAKLGENPAECVYSVDEATVINKFADMLLGVKREYDFTELLFVGHNVLFDLGFIYVKLLQYGRKDAAKYLPKGMHDPNIYCTMKHSNIFNKNYISLNDACKTFGLEGKTEGFDGSKVYDAFLDGKHSEIAEYCKQDVEATFNLYSKLKL